MKQTTKYKIKIWSIYGKIIEEVKLETQIVIFNPSLVTLNL